MRVLEGLQKAVHEHVMHVRLIVLYGNVHGFI